MAGTPLIITSALLVIFALLLFPVLTSMSPKPRHQAWALTHVKTAVKLSFIVSLLPLALFLYSGSEAILSTPQLISMGTFGVKLSFKFDHYSLIFIPVALYVTWCILDFADWYMDADPNKNRFFKYLLVFLVAMLILVTANNLYQLFIGWEGVGIMSFLLIGWWYGRAEANVASIQAILYNRIGDIGFIFALAWTGLTVQTWELSDIAPLAADRNMLPALMGLIVGATGKSAQFGLHPWLPSAMEGPTPVSALLHSSTMVVAGIFLLIRVSPIMEHYPIALTTCLWLGALTTLFTAICALTQHDIKKVIAFSTSSQLGLMMATVGLGFPQLAFLHICTHAFFKAMLFLCSGSFIHALNDEQDIRKMGGMYTFTPFTSACATLGSLALMGTPFLAGFFSKDAIVEAFNTSYLNACALILIFIATILTAFYSIRLMCFVISGSPRFCSFMIINENSPALMNPLKRLAWGSIVAGFLITASFPPLKTAVMTMPALAKGAALLLTLFGAVLAWELYKLATKFIKEYNRLISSDFSTQLGYFPSITHRFPPLVLLGLGQVISHQVVDQAWLEKAGPKTTASSNIPLATTMSDAQRGVIKGYLGMSLLTLTLATFLAVL